MPQLRILELSSKGELRVTENWLRKLLRIDLQSVLDRYGKRGVELLAAATPKRTGKTADSWSYRTRLTRTSEGGIKNATIEWYNNNVTDSNGVHIPIVILIECGHGTRNGGYVPPNPFISDTIKPVFDELAEKLWKEVKDA